MEELLAQGRRAFEDGDLDQAEVAWTGAYQLDPNHAPTLALLKQLPHAAVLADVAAPREPALRSAPGSPFFFMPLTQSGPASEKPRPAAPPSTPMITPRGAYPATADLPLVTSTDGLADVPELQRRLRAEQLRTQGLEKAYRQLTQQHEAALGHMLTQVDAQIQQRTLALHQHVAELQHGLALRDGQLEAGRAEIQRLAQAHADLRAMADGLDAELGQTRRALDEALRANRDNGAQRVQLAQVEALARASQERATALEHRQAELLQALDHARKEQAAAQETVAGAHQAAVEDARRDLRTERLAHGETRVRLGLVEAERDRAQAALDERLGALEGARGESVRAKQALEKSDRDLRRAHQDRDALQEELGVVTARERAAKTRLAEVEFALGSMRAETREANEKRREAETAAADLEARVTQQQALLERLEQALEEASARAAETFEKSRRPPPAAVTQTETTFPMQTAPVRVVRDEEGSTRVRRMVRKGPTQP